MSVQSNVTEGVDRNKREKLANEHSVLKAEYIIKSYFLPDRITIV